MLIYFCAGVAAQSPSAAPVIMTNDNTKRPMVAILYYISIGSVLAYCFRTDAPIRDGQFGYMIFTIALGLSGVLMCYTLYKAYRGDRTATLIAMIHGIALFSSVVRLVLMLSFH